MTSDYVVKGVITWESIGDCIALGKQCETVDDCTVPPQEISVAAPLFDAVDTIADHGYVLVRNEKNEISGIVTASDLSYQFRELAEPFLLVGEIEGYLRRLIRRIEFADEELQSLANPEIDGKIQSIDELTFGEYCRILQNPKYWERLDLKIDRQIFVKRLDSCREIRNSIMHFNPEDAVEDIRILRDVAHFLEHLAHLGL